jgi:hypothetical protein
MLASLARAQGEAPQAVSTLAADLSRTVQAHVRTALERHLRPEEFQAFAVVTPVENGAPKIPYMPETLSPIAGPEASPESLAPLVKRIEIEVLISDRYDSAAQAKLKTILQKSLALNEARGDSVSFSPLGLQVERAESDVARDLARTEADVRTARTERDQLARDRDDAKRETEAAKRDLAVAKTELERVARETSAPRAKASSEAGKAPESAAAAAGQPAETSFWRENIATIVAAIIALLAIFAASVALKFAAKTLAEAVQSIGSGLPVMAEKLSESLAQKPALLPPPEYGTRPDSQSAASAVAPLAPSLPLEMVAKRVLELHDELLSVVTDENETHVIAYLSQLLGDNMMIERAVATMELLGKERANQLYNRMAPSHQQVILTFLKGGRYSRPKGEVVIEAGEALKTKLFGAGFSRRAQLGDPVAEKLLFLGVEDLVAVANRLEGEALARFFLYLEAPRLSEILSRLREKDPKRFDKAALMVVKMPEVETAKNLDQDLLAAVEQQLERANSDIQAPYLQLYRSLVEMADDEVAESLAESFAAAHPRVERFIRESVITFGTFFKLHGDIQEEIVTGLSNKDMASVVAMLKPELKGVFFEHVEERRKELIAEEVDRLAARGPRQVTAAHRAAKRQVVGRIVQIKGQGPLSDLLAAPVEGLPAASSQSGPKAA